MCANETDKNTTSPAARGGRLPQDISLTICTVLSQRDDCLLWLQAALNAVLRGREVGQAGMRSGLVDENDSSILHPAAMHQAGVRYLPVSSFANQYTYGTARAHKVRVDFFFFFSTRLGMGLGSALRLNTRQDCLRGADGAGRGPAVEQAP